MLEWIGDIFTQTFGYAFLPEDQQPSEEELSAMYMDSLNSASTAVLQDGDDPAYDSGMYSTNVRPETTADVQEAFELSNMTSPIEVEITEAFSWDTPEEIAYLELDMA